MKDKEALLEFQKRYHEALAEIESLRQKLAIAEEALGFYANGAGLDLVDEGRNFMSNYVAYENHYEGDHGMDKPVGTHAKKALAKIRGEG